MQANEMESFGEMVTGVMELYGAALSPMAARIWWEALKAYDFAAVSAALSRHVQDPDAGRFAPKPADVIRAMGITATPPPSDGRLGADEAWSIAIVCSDESATVVWTEEIAQAFGIASPILDLGDKVGARMAFRDAYDRLVLQARDRGAPCVWSVSLGSDANGRAAAITAAVDAGRLTVEKARCYLPAPEPGGMVGGLVAALLSDDRKALAGYAGSGPSAARGIAMARAELERLSGQAREREAEQAQQRAAEQAEFFGRKQAAIAEISRMQEERGESAESPQEASGQ